MVADDVATGRFGRPIATRFPPEPNGYPHIGHVKAICLNFGIAQEFGGRCNLRFDDTNPSTEDIRYVEAIKNDIRWLGFEWDAELYASDYFGKLYEFAELLVQKGSAYVDSQSGEQIRETRGTVTVP
ncbi:MAG: glutamate--tRNA ligase family protein, partial [Gemmatimonadota bacterium]|nr:glutamate--tRNA ligase family protein [Gemmatimonadota bacterium]